ncbi:hypothetical protein L7F22_054142 [Adiantum nelumboides]|nr:hypothetical protein [Adiantum nelumboides]
MPGQEQGEEVGFQRREKAVPAALLGGKLAAKARSAAASPPTPPAFTHKQPIAKRHIKVSANWRRLDSPIISIWPARGGGQHERIDDSLASSPHVCYNGPTSYRFVGVLLRPLQRVSASILFSGVRDSQLQQQVAQWRLHKAQTPLPPLPLDVI